MFNKILPVLGLLSTSTLCFASHLINDDTQHFESLNQFSYRIIQTNKRGSSTLTQPTISSESSEKIYIPTNERETLIAHIKDLADTQADTMPLLTKLLMQTPAGERSKLIEQASELASPASSRENITYILKELLQVPFIERPSIINQVSQLVSPAMNCKEISNIIAPLSQIPFSARQSTIESVKNIINRIQQISPSKIDGEVIQSLVQKHQVLKPEDFTNFFNLLEKLIITVSHTENQVNSLVSPLLQPHMSERDVKSIRRSLLTVCPDERSLIIEQVKHISRPSMTGGEINSILFYLTEVPFTKRQEIIETVKNSITQNMDRYSMSARISEFSNEFIKSQISIHEQAESVLSSDMTSDEVSYIINVLSYVPYEERQSIIEKSTPFISPTMNGYNRGDIIIMNIFFSAEETQLFLNLSSRLENLAHLLK